jgi:hypothetical protein
MYVCIFFNQIQKKNSNSTEIHKFTYDFAATLKKILTIWGIPVKLKRKN